MLLGYLLKHPASGGELMPPQIRLAGGQNVEGDKGCGLGRAFVPRTAQPD
jgi:hypothetical protein